MIQTGNAKADALWNTFAQDPCVENKNELVVHYLYLVKGIVFRLLPIYREYANFDDLLSCGVLGLIDAINKYAIMGDVRFEYYATMRIRGEIIDHMRKQDWAPSSLRRKIQSIGQAYAELEKEFSRQPTDKEVAQHLGMDEKKMLQVIEKTHVFNVLHFEEMLSEEGGAEYNVKDRAQTPEEQIVGREIRAVLGELIEALPEKERLVITLYYYEEMNLKEIASILGVTESRVSQIHSKVILKIRTKMKRLLDE